MDLVQSPTPVIMEGKIAGLARQGRLDDALMQLLDANLQQAQLAGDAGKGAVAVLSKLKTRVQKEVDAKLEPEVPPRLLAKAIQEIKHRFGNVDENYDTGFVKRLQTIAEEAESIALELADGKEITAQQT